MSRSRFACFTVVSALTSVPAILFFNKKLPRPTRVTMKATEHADTLFSSIGNYSFLILQLAPDTHTPDIFMASLLRQQHQLSVNQVHALATLAIDHQHITQLDALAGMFPQIITRDWVNSRLLQADNPALFAKLLYEKAIGKLAHLDYLFDTENPIVLIEQNDQTKIELAALFSKKAKILLIDSDPYEPGYRALSC